MDSQQHSNIDFRGYAVQILDSAVPKSMTFYAVDSLVRTFDKYGVTALDLDTLKLWIAVMLMSGMKINTVKRYAGRIHTLFNEWKEKDTADPFNEIQNFFGQSYQPDDTVVLHNLDILKRLFALNEASKDWKIVSMFFYLLYNADITLLDLVNADFDNAPKYCAQIDNIVKSRDSAYGRKYLFDLNQSKARPTQILRELSEGLTLLMKNAGMKIVNGHVREDITSIWVSAAMKCGIDMVEIRSMIPSVPYNYRALSLVQKKELSEDRRHEIICQVADLINDNTPRWFVMKLRKKISVDDIRERLNKELPGRLDTMELFYPSRIESKKVGRKIIKNEIPYVPDMLFFKTQYNKVASLFTKIGDLAWCFKVSQIPDSKYSVISHEEMSNFQKCVGHFTADIHVKLVSASRALGIGRMVRITGGMMKGYKGRIEDVNDGKGTRTFFLCVSNDNALKWTAEVEDVFIEPLNQ